MSNLMLEKLFGKNKQNKQNEKFYGARKNRKPK